MYLSARLYFVFLYLTQNAIALTHIVFFVIIKSKIVEDISALYSIF